MKPQEVTPIYRDPTGRVMILDQRLLPFEETWIACNDATEVAAAIHDMAIRGAPAIGVAAAYGLALGARAQNDLTPERFEALCRELAAARPTAVNLFWAIGRMRERFATLVAGGARGTTLHEALDAEAQAIRDEDLAMNHAIGRHGAELIPRGARILTHCNTGSLATAGWGTALGVIRSAHAADPSLKVFADETRPYLQGARLTAWELMQDGIDVTLIPDGAAGHLMRTGDIDLAIVGADRIAHNGDTANKIGTYMVATLCARHGLPFYVAAPTSTIDLATPDGSAIPIEERPAREVREVFGKPVAPPDVKVRNPSFDVTPSDLITAIITERGVARPDFRDSLAALMRL
jgi:methylthioribose-1-phosphate isomerase